MSDQALAALYACFDGSIKSMSNEFNAHVFILHLAKHNQREYVRALNEVRGDEPFRAVHSAVANRLNSHENELERLGDDKSSLNIFGERMSCSRWRKK